MIQWSPAVLGVLIVIQAGLNRKIAAAWGLPFAALLNATVLLICAAGLVGWVGLRSEGVPDVLRLHGDLSLWKPWFLVPGILGLTLVLGGPWAVARFGAVHAFVLIISAQLAASLLWDLQVEGRIPSRVRLLGVGITWIGALLACKSS